MSQFDNFLEASKYLQTQITLTRIHEGWNNSDNGRPAKMSTIKRWLNNGPKTKNVKFEPFIQDWADSLKDADQIVAAVRQERLKKDEQVRDVVEVVRTAVAGKHFQTVRQLATAASLIAFYDIDPHFSKQQVTLLSSVANQCTFRLT